MRLVHYILSHPGKRKSNEDSVFPEHVNGVGARSFIVCDGVGGHRNGEIASGIVSREVGQRLVMHEAPGEREILEAIDHAEKKLAEHSDDFPDCKGMASTLVGFHPIDDEKGYAYWVGDSRLYHIRNSEIVFKTKDHSLVQMMVDSGEMTEAEALSSRSKNVIMQAINDGRRKAEPEIALLEDLREGDYILLLSDGILEGCTEDDLVLHLNSNPLKEAVTEIRKKCEVHSNDNFSLIAIEIHHA